jgi:Domain of Unknown Function with PDB structure (DUF3857)/Transglutaminase-like superfamily
MARRWSSSGGRLALLALALPAQARAATILEQAITIEIRADGMLAEHTQLAVRLDSAHDLAAWSPYPIFLDENRKLVDLAASATQPDGRVVKVGRKGLDTAEVAGESELHSSRKVRTVEIPAVPVGSTFHLDYRIEERPYFPSGYVPVGAERDPIEKLRIEVRHEGSQAGWRWRLDGPRDGLDIQETTAGGVVVTASGLPAVHAPEDAPERLGAVLRYAWGPVSTWQGIGRWYQELVAAVPQGREAVRRKAAEIAGGIAGVASRRQKIEALAAFARKDVRYVAVEVGIGGYRPEPPEEVLTRRWGDCKDKSLLLIDLLADAGIPAYPALLRLDPKGRVDADFPSPNEFNHLIVAVPTAGLDLQPDDPVSEGYLFIDATETLGSAFWLPAYDQDQEALVVRGERSVLVRTAVRPAVEARFLEVTLAADAQGDGVGQAQLEIRGEGGASWVNRAATRRPEENEADARALLAVALPGANLSALRVQPSREGVPALRISARVQIPGLVPPGPAGAAGSVNGVRSFQPAALHGLPAPGLLDGRKVPVVLTPKVTRSVWRLQLSASPCRPVGMEPAVDNDLGSFRQQATFENGLLTIERSSEVKRRWIDPDHFPALKELALAEHRAGRRFIRLECAGGEAPR